MGSGFNHIYPAENKELLEEISQSGAVVSEFPLDMLSFKQNFPRRNRVISGLSPGVLVTEAARNSGALITADFALEQGREVFRRRYATHLGRRGFRIPTVNTSYLEYQQMN